MPTNKQLEKSRQFSSFGWEFDGSDQDKVYMQRWQFMYEAKVRVGLRIEIDKEGNVKELR